MGPFRKTISNLLAICFLTIAAGFGNYYSHPQGDSEEGVKLGESFGYLDHATLALPTGTIFQSQVESFKFPVDQFCFTGYPFSAQGLESNSLIFGWWKQRLVFFDLSRVLYPFHFFW